MLHSDINVNWDTAITTPNGYYSAAVTCKDSRTDLLIIARSPGGSKSLTIKHKLTGAVDLKTDSHTTRHAYAPMDNSNTEHLYLKPWKIHIVPKGKYITFLIVDERYKVNPVTFELNRHKFGCDLAYTTNGIDKH